MFALLASFMVGVVGHRQITAYSAPLVVWVTPASAAAR